MQRIINQMRLESTTALAGHFSAATAASCPGISNAPSEAAAVLIRSNFARALPLVTGLKVLLASSNDSVKLRSTGLTSSSELSRMGCQNIAKLVAAE
jgi:hypothetical protein